MAKIEVVPVPPDHHGEGPAWLEREQTLVWVDVYEEPSIQRFVPGTGKFTMQAMPAPTSCLAPAAGSGLLAGMVGGFHLVDDEGRTSFIADPSVGGERELLCDGKCDPAGRFWCASLSRDFVTPIGKLYRLDSDGSCREMDHGFLTGNGVAFSPEADRLYVADSRAEIVWQYDFDARSGTVHNKRPFFSSVEMPGRPDGATVDSDGNYWCAMVDGSSVIAMDPKGKIIERIVLPVRFPTMCTFGGARRETLYVTTSRLRLDEEQRRQQPLAGNLFAIHDIGATGLPALPFAG